MELTLQWGHHPSSKCPGFGEQQGGQQRRSRIAGSWRQRCHFGLVDQNKNWLLLQVSRAPWRAWGRGLTWLAGKFWLLCGEQTESWGEGGGWESSEEVTGLSRPKSVSSARVGVVVVVVRRDGFWIFYIVFWFYVKNFHISAEKVRVVQRTPAFLSPTFTDYK